MSAPTKNEKLTRWVDEIATLCQPANVHWCDGSPAEYQRMCELMLASKTAVKLSEMRSVPNAPRLS